MAILHRLLLRTPTGVRSTRKLRYRTRSIKQFPYKKAPRPSPHTYINRLNCQTLGSTRSTSGCWLPNAVNLGGVTPGRNL